MKNLITFLLILFAFQFVNAQSLETNDRIFKKFKVDISLGYAIPQESGGAGSQAGALFALEPKYAVADAFSVGLRLEGAAMAHLNSDGTDGNVKVNYSYLATGDYYFTNKRFRPFGGIGAGIFTHSNLDLIEYNSSTNQIPSNSHFGFMARTGFEYGHLRIGVEYNFVTDNNGYLGLKIGGVIGGGRKNK
ncbi:MAG: hypothetical protein ABI297_01335 [Ginsengibacter sp.]